jgi:hypothetical protein
MLSCDHTVDDTRGILKAHRGFTDGSPWSPSGFLWLATNEVLKALTSCIEELKLSAVKPFKIERN